MISHTKANSLFLPRCPSLRRLQYLHGTTYICIKREGYPPKHTQPKITIFLCIHIIIRYMGYNAPTSKSFALDLLRCEFSPPVKQSLMLQYSYVHHPPAQPPCNCIYVTPYIYLKLYLPISRFPRLPYSLLNLSQSHIKLKIQLNTPYPIQS